MVDLSAVDLTTTSPDLEVSTSQQKCVLFADNIVTSSLQIGSVIFSQGNTIQEAIQIMLLRYNLIGKPFATGPPAIFDLSICFSHKGFHWVGNPIFCLGSK